MPTELEASILRATEFLTGLRQDDYRESWSVFLWGLNFPGNPFRTGGINPMVGDIFPLTMILDALVDSYKILGREATRATVSEDIVARLLPKRKGKAWNYFPKTDLLPPDTDDTSLALIVLSRARPWVDNVDLLCREIGETLAGQFSPEEYVHTWIVEEDLREENNKMWGGGITAEITATAGYALGLCDDKRFSEPINKATKYLLREQQEDGTWTNVWYCNKLYCIVRCLQLFQHSTRVNETFLPTVTEATRKSTSFLTKYSPENSLEHGLRLHGLVLAAERAPTMKRPSLAMNRSVSYLVSHQSSDGGFESQPLHYFPTWMPDRVREIYSREAPDKTVYGSRATTTSIGLQALARFHIYSDNYSSARQLTPPISL